MTGRTAAREARAADIAKVSFFWGEEVWGEEVRGQRFVKKTESAGKKPSKIVWHRRPPPCSLSLLPLFFPPCSLLWEGASCAVASNQSRHARNFQPGRDETTRGREKQRALFERERDKFQKKTPLEREREGGGIFTRKEGKTQSFVVLLLLFGVVAIEVAVI